MAVDCPYCGALFRSRADLREHIDRNHGNHTENKRGKWDNGKPGPWTH